MRRPLEIALTKVFTNVFSKGTMMVTEDGEIVLRSSNNLQQPTESLDRNQEKLDDPALHKSQQ
jgi:hypothetical protein